MEQNSRFAILSPPQPNAEVTWLRAFGQARFNAGLGSRLQNGGVSAALKYRQDNDAMFLRTKINAVRETIGDDTPNVLANDGKLEMAF